MTGTGDLAQGSGISGIPVLYFCPTLRAPLDSADHLNVVLSNTR